MKRFSIIVFCLLMSCLFCPAELRANDIASDVSISKGDYGISFVKWFGSSSFCIDYGYMIYINPSELPQNPKNADIILITNSSPANLNFESLKKISGGYPQLYAPAAVIDSIKKADVKLSDGQLHVIKPFDKITESSYEFETVPAFSPDKAAYPQESGWVGYIITIPTPRGICRLYFTGDTGKIAAMDSLKDTLDVVFIPMGAGTVIEDTAEAVEIASLLNAEIVVPVFNNKSGEADSAARFFTEQLGSIDGIDGVILPLAEEN